MKFVVYQKELEQAFCHSPGEYYYVNSSLSVNGLMRHFFSTLKKLGTLIAIKQHAKAQELKSICTSSGVIFVGFHEEPPHKLPCRFLVHTKGSLLLPGAFLNALTFQKSTCNVMTSQIQREQFQKKLSLCAATTGLLVPCPDSAFHETTHTHFLKSKTKKGLKIVYAGRLIANKGICQAIRALNLWPLVGAQLTIFGSFEPEFPILWCNSSNSGFKKFFLKECNANRFLKIEMREALKPEELAKHYRNSDVFVYPSFHEDENYGMAPREAILCGMVAVVSDFCGLAEIGLFDCHRSVTTYPTLAGLRFSLKELRDKIAWAGTSLNTNKEGRAVVAQKIRDCCTEKESIKTLKTDCEKLLELRPSAPQNPGWRSKSRLHKWLVRAPEAFQRAASFNPDLPIEGLYPEGCKAPSSKLFLDCEFRRAIQSIFTTLECAPRVSVLSVYRGFWRLGLLSSKRTLIEYGYPGPRRITFMVKEWQLIIDSLMLISNCEMEFRCRNASSIPILQKLVNLGYIVPDEIEQP
jgi:glycosyltransferase involved in cell wall biosynthesis